ncbi:MAG TPA: PilZ domain-containing protein [Pirellulales bacterium]|nr:PilZ domain-containing protein [Pirellulales bacterium]
MPLEIWNFVGRKPRHHVADASQVSVRLNRANAEFAGGLTAELIDFARNGAQLRVADEPDAAWPSNGEAVVLELRSEKPGLDIRLPGKIRWQQAEGPGQWLIGCEFDEEVSLETLGELFLAEILSDRRSTGDDEAPGGDTI